MKKYQLMMMTAIGILFGAGTAVEGGALQLAAGVVLAVVGGCGLVFSLLALDVFDFPQGSVGERIGVSIRQFVLVRARLALTSVPIAEEGGAKAA